MCNLQQDKEEGYFTSRLHTKNTKYRSARILSKNSSNDGNPLDLRLKCRETELMFENFDFSLFFFRVVQKRSRLPREDFGQG